MTSRTRITHYADIDVAAIANRHAGRDQQLWFRYALGGLNHRGSGTLSGGEVEAAASMLGIRARTLQRLVNGGDNIFWTRASQARLFIHSFDRIGAALGVNRVRAAYLAPMANRRGRLASVRAQMAVRGLAAIRHGRPISIQAAARLFRSSRRTVQRWVAMSGVAVISNFVLVAPLRLSTPMQYSLVTGEPGLRAVSVDGKPWLVRQIANTFQPVGIRGVRLRLRRVDRRLRSRLAGQTTSDNRAGSNVVRARYRRLGGWRSTPAPRSPHYSYLKASHKDGRRIGLWEHAGPPEELGC